MKKKSTSNVALIITYILIIMVIVAMLGSVAYFTDGFTSNVKSFKVSIDDQVIKDEASGYVMYKDVPCMINVEPVLSLGSQVDYTVKVVPNVNEDTNFDICIDGEYYAYSDITDLTKCFTIEKQDKSFTIAPKGRINDLLKILYPDSEIEDCTDKVYDDMFKLIISSSDEKTVVSVNFKVIGGDLKLDKEVISF